MKLEATAARGHRERRKAETRAELLLAGRSLFSEKGLYESRIEDLSSAAGIAKGTLYQYFDGRDELILAVVEEGYREMGRHLHERLGSPRTLEQAVLRLALGYLEFFDRNRDLMRILHQVRGLLKFDQERWRGLKRLLEVHLEDVAGELRKASNGRGAGLVRGGNLAVVIYGGVSGYASVRAALDPAGSLLEDSRALARAFVAVAGRWGAGNPGKRNS